MADSDKNILITPSRGSTTDLPKIEFTGADPNTITLSVLDDATLSFSGASGQLFSISDSLTGTIFSVNDVSGIPSIEVDDDGTVRLAEFAGNLLVGTDVNAGDHKVQIKSDVSDHPLLIESAFSDKIKLKNTNTSISGNGIGFYNSDDKMTGSVQTSWSSSFKYTELYQSFNTNADQVRRLRLKPGENLKAVYGSTEYDIWHSGIFANNSANWNTAYGWGDHSTQGYLTSVAFSDLTSTPSTISGYGITDAFDGAYSSLTGKPTLFSGSYTDLTNKPVIPTDYGDHSTQGYLTSYTETDPVFSSSVASFITGSQDNFVFGGVGGVNQASIILNTVNAGSPQITFSDNGGDMTWAIGGDDGDNHFKLHGNYNATIPVINNLATPHFEWRSGGDFVAQGNITAYSDKSLKKDISVIEDAIGKIKQLDGVTFKKIYDEDDKTHCGVIAQQVQEVLPEAVIKHDTGLLSVAYGNMVSLLIEGIKEQDAKIEALQAQINKLL